MIEHNKLFPEQAVSSRRISFSTGLMNLFTPFFGGVPMCHGAGGMAGHVRFGARTGGATVILGIVLVGMALFFGQSLTLILPIFPVAVLGVIMILAGTVLINSAYSADWSREHFFLATITAGITLWHAGAGLFIGIILSYVLKRVKV